MKLGVFGNFADVKAPNLLLTDPDTGEPRPELHDPDL